jgi:hypothetical protein
MQLPCLLMPLLSSMMVVVDSSTKPAARESSAELSTKHSPSQHCALHQTLLSATWWWWWCIAAPNLQRRKVVQQSNRQDFRVTTVHCVMCVCVCVRYGDAVPQQASHQQSCRHRPQTALKTLARPLCQQTLTHKKILPNMDQTRPNCVSRCNTRGSS